MTLTPETIAGILIAVGAFGALIYKMGWVVFGKATEPQLPERRHCPEIIMSEVKHMCQDHKSVIESIRAHEEGSKRREEKIDNMSVTLIEMSRSVSAIEGFLQGRNGFHK